MTESSFGPLDEIELCVNVWWFVHNDLHVVTHGAAKAYALAGDDEAKYAALQAMASSDYASVTWHACWTNHTIILPDGRKVEGAVPFTDAFRNDPSRFEPLLRRLELELPTHPLLGTRERIDRTMAMGKPLLSVETIVKYDASGLIGPVVGGEEDLDDEEDDEGFIPDGPDEIKAEAFFAVGPSAFHNWRTMPRGLMFAF